MGDEQAAATAPSLASAEMLGIMRKVIKVVASAEEEYHRRLEAACKPGAQWDATTSATMEIGMMASALLRERIAKAGVPWDAYEALPAEAKPWASLKLLSADRQPPAALWDRLSDIRKGKVSWGSAPFEARSATGDVRHLKAPAYEALAWHVAMLADLLDSVAKHAWGEGKPAPERAAPSEGDSESARQHVELILELLEQRLKDWAGWTEYYFSPDLAGLALDVILHDEDLAPEFKPGAGALIQTVSVRSGTVAMRILRGVLDELPAAAPTKILERRAEIATLLDLAEKRQRTSGTTWALQEYAEVAANLVYTSSHEKSLGDALQLAYLMLSQADLSNRRSAEKDERAEARRKRVEIVHDSEGLLAESSKILARIRGWLLDSDRLPLVVERMMSPVPIEFPFDDDERATYEEDPASFRNTLYVYDYSAPLYIKCAAELAEQLLTPPDDAATSPDAASLAEASEWLRSSLLVAKTVMATAAWPAGNLSNSNAKAQAQRAVGHETAFRAYVQDAFSFLVFVMLGHPEVIAALRKPPASAGDLDGLRGPGGERPLAASTEQSIGRLAREFGAVVRGLMVSELKDPEFQSKVRGVLGGDPPDGEAAQGAGRAGAGAGHTSPGLIQLGGALQDVALLMEFAAYCRVYCLRPKGGPPAKRSVLLAELVSLRAGATTTSVFSELAADAAYALMMDRGKGDIRPRMVEEFLSKLQASGTEGEAGGNLLKKDPRELWQQGKFCCWLPDDAEYREDKGSPAEFVEVGRFPGADEPPPLMHPAVTFGLLRWVCRGFKPPAGKTAKKVPPDKLLRALK